MLRSGQRLPGDDRPGGKAAAGRIADYHSGHTVPAIPVGNLTPRGFADFWQVFRFQLGIHHRVFQTQADVVQLSAVERLRLRKLPCDLHSPPDPLESNQVQPNPAL